jgi:hypothetical protein
MSRRRRELARTAEVEQHERAVVLQQQIAGCGSAWKTPASSTWRV